MDAVSEQGLTRIEGVQPADLRLSPETERVVRELWRWHEESAKSEKRLGEEVKP